MTEQEFIAKFKKHGFELYKTKALKLKLDAFHNIKGIANSIKMFAIFLTIAVALSACNSTKVLTDSTKKFLVDHNVQASVTPNPTTGTTKFHASIDSLYPNSVEKIKAIAPQADIIYKVSEGKIILQGEAKGVLGADKIAELYVAVIKAISFWKK
jgi:uncharacterized protein YceK